MPKAPKAPALARRVTELEEALSREKRISQALREVGNALGTTLDLDDLLELILENLTDLIEADRATLYLLDEPRNELVSRIVVGQQVRSIRLKLGHGIVGAVAESGEIVRVDDAYEDGRFAREWDALTGYKTTSMLAAPLKNHLGRTIGVIQALNKKGAGSFTDDDEAMVRALSTQAAVAIDNSRLFISLIQKNKQLLDTKDQLERRVRDLELLFDLERATARTDSVDSLVRAALGLLTRACEARGAALLLAEEETGDLIEYAFDAERPDDLQRLGVKSGDGILAQVMADDEVIVVDDVAFDAHLSDRVEGLFSFPIDSLLAHPLEGEFRPMGAIGIFTKHAGLAFDPEDQALVRLVAANVSTAVRLFRAKVSRENSARLTTIGSLLSGVIHDFKTPMTVISGYVQLMQDTDDAETRQDYAEEILKQFDLVSDMQREVLEFARGERSIFVRRVYLRKFFGELRRQLELELEGKPVELTMDVDSKGVARFDEGRVSRAVHNLSRNAIEAMMPRGGTLHLAAEVIDGELVIQVADTGPGIPKEVEGRLFQSFVTAGKQGGTGLGLAIVKKIIEEHDGTVEVKSTRRGATFLLRIPQARPDKKAGGGTRKGAPKAGNGKTGAARRPGRPRKAPPEAADSVGD